jgi:hypothetical protein
MTAIEAKELSLEVWGYLRDHPDIARKVHLPPYLFEKIKDMCFCCPLCEYFNKGCGECPLDGCSMGSLFAKWKEAIGADARRAAAQAIYDRIAAWEAA